METYPETQVAKIGKVAMKHIGMRDEEFYEVINIILQTAFCGYQNKENEKFKPVLLPVVIQRVLIFPMQIKILI